MALNTTSRRIDGIIVVTCIGALVFDEEATSLRVLVKDLLKECRQIVLDLGDITHIDSIGLGTLVALHISARNLGGGMKLANVRNRVKEALQITRLVTVFEVFDTPEDAIASFTRAAAAG